MNKKKDGKSKAINDEKDIFASQGFLILTGADQKPLSSEDVKKKVTPEIQWGKCVELGDELTWVG